MRFPILFIVLIFSLPLFSQNSVFDRFTLRKSFGSKAEKAEAANFTYTRPRDKEDSWLVNAALGYEILSVSNSSIVLSPYLEVHKNTLIDKEQDNLEIGASFEWQTNKRLIESKWSPIIIGTAEYNRDNEKNTTSFQGTALLTPLFNGKNFQTKFFWIPNIASNFGKAFQFYYSPYIGFENENRLSTPSDSIQGNIYRGIIRVQAYVSLLPLHDKLRGRINIAIDWQNRWILRETVDDFNKKQQRYFVASISYVFFKSMNMKKSASIGIDFINGENPTKNFEDQSFSALSLKIKL